MFRNLIPRAYAQFDSPTAGRPAPGSSSSIGDYHQLLQNILDNIINPLILLMTAAAVVYFLWGVFDFVRNAENPEKRQEGGTHMLYGAIGLFLMVTAYGVLNLILGTIGKN